MRKPSEIYESLDWKTRYKIETVLATALVLSIVFGILGVFFTLGMESQKNCMLQHACDSACGSIRSGESSHNALRVQNICVCNNSVVMRGEYRQLFLHGKQTQGR